MPAEQLVQLDMPAVGWYLPKAQFKQVVALDTTENLPASQLVQLAAPAAEYDPIKQAEQVAETARA